MQSLLALQMMMQLLWRAKKSSWVKKNSSLTQPSFTAHLELPVHGDGVKLATDAE